nr:hypothetical protein [Mycoplasmopsis bovis]
MNKDNLVSCDDLAGSKKYRFFKPINKGAFYELDIEKILRRSKIWWILCLRNKQNRFISKRSY